jgi:hypothetical protein
VVDDQIEQCREIAARPVERVIRPAVEPRGVHMRKIELIVVGVEAGEEVEYLVEYAVGLGGGLVGLVEHHDRAQPEPQRLGGYELGLWHRPFGGIYEQHDSIDHAQDAFDLATEIGVSGGVDDVDAGTFPDHRGGLGEDGDAALAFEVVAVHRALVHGLPGAKGTGLFEQLVHERGLAVVDMGDDGDITQIHWALS